MDVVALRTQDSSNELTELVKERFRDLTTAERQILSFLVEGWKDTEIAKLRGVSVETVRCHVKRIFDKLCVRTRTTAAVLAVTIGGYEPDLESLLREG